MKYKKLEMSEVERAAYLKVFELDGCTYDPGDCNMIDRVCTDKFNKVGRCIGSDEEDWCLLCGSDYVLERNEDEH